MISAGSAGRNGTPAGPHALGSFSIESILSTNRTAKPALQDTKEIKELHVGPTTSSSDSHMNLVAEASPREDGTHKEMSSPAPSGTCVIQTWILTFDYYNYTRS